MPKGNLSPGRIAVIAGFALSCFGLLLFLWIAFGGTSPLKPKGYRFEAAFKDAATLAVQADVRVAGVSVGKVVAKRRDPRGNATLAEIELQAQYAPLKQDAKAILRQKTLLGETYVELTTGSKDAKPIAEGERLADARVARTVEFDDFLQQFDPDTRRAFQQWQRSTAKAFEGEGQTVSNVLGGLPGFVGNGADVVDVLNRRRESLRQVVRGTADTFEELTANEAALQGLVTGSRSTFEALASRREALAESFRIFPTFLRESRATLRRLEDFSGDATPLVRDLRPVLSDAEPTVRSLRVLAPDLEDLLQDVRPLVAAGQDGLPALSRVLRGLRPTLAEMGPMLQQLNPILEFLELYQATVSDFLNVAPSALKLDLTDRPGTNGHALPQLIVVGSQTLPAAQRTPDNRGNAYFPPDGYFDSTGLFASRETLPSFDCNHVGDKGFDSTPACYTARDVPFQGRTTRFPQVRPGEPGGVIERTIDRGDRADDGG